jgi:iron complex transport system substrate-binding protein
MAFTSTRKRMRIVSLAPSVTSILVALGARKLLVGVSKWCAEVANVGRLPRLGDCWSLDVHAIMKLRPEVVIGSVPFKTETVEKLLALPVAFVATNPRSLADIESDIRLLGRIAGRSAAAEKLIQRMRREFAAISAQARRRKSHPKIYCEAWPNPRITSPPWVRELAEIAGARMVLDPGSRVTDEDVAQAMPDVIVIAWTATGDRPSIRRTLENPAWKDVPAVRNRRVIVLRDELLNTPGPPLVQGAKELFRAIHSPRRE